MNYKNLKGFSKIDKDISDYVLAEVRKKDYMFSGLFHKALGDYSYKTKAFDNGCFSEALNLAYEDTLEKMRNPPTTRREYLEMIVR